MSDQTESKSQPKHAAAIFAALVLIITIFVAVQPKRPRELTHEEKLCAGKSQLECFEALEIERKRRAFLESPEGQSLMKAGELTK